MKTIRTLVAIIAISMLPITSGGTSAMAQVLTGDSYPAEAAINNAGARAAKIARIIDVPSVGVINLAFRSLPRFRNNVTDVSEFRVNAEKNAGGINRLRKALRNNPATREALASYGVSINRVVGVDVGSNGSLRIYVL